jgi:hypothetical protein
MTGPKKVTVPRGSGKSDRRKFLKSCLQAAGFAAAGMAILGGCKCDEEEVEWSDEEDEEGRRTPRPAPAPTPPPEETTEDTEETE